MSNANDKTERRFFAAVKFAAAILAKNQNNRLNSHEIESCIYNADNLIEALEQPVRSLKPPSCYGEFEEIQKWNRVCEECSRETECIKLSARMEHERSKQLIPPPAEQKPGCG